ncbi:bifunctional SulP family inorganic anion transporter/carbonic anhydrase [Amycolatopsis regifaucium]|uniref:carbonic anhydrase n=1 Tax=Amycolatopsis regifaucium TaxID=546365 RepID=A0A154MMT6_9PSEU|nr:bifunctional SulP family inorganic anion transporter/carbonic anhydrase [Amycolatopsis regifaucium]KZB85642.1 carbonic anhydrase [Amycolatopsis regifaucium]OKA10605.1 carbonic anhydrase [Amycolatopsis regifaucium]SFI83816.1 carbonic anhydrase [Amycolatopsis regifaucium]
MIDIVGDEHDTGPPGRRNPTSTLLKNLRHDIPASVVVFLVAVPLSLGVAHAAGAPLLAGLVSAVVGGLVASLCGGSALQVSGPSAALTVVLAETIAAFGWAATCAITAAAGVVQILFGISRVAKAALAISPAIVHGLLAGIGLIIVLGQLHVVLGGAAQGSAIANVLALPGQLVGHHDQAALIGVVTVGVLLAWTRMPSSVRRVPGPLAAVAVATGLSVAAGMDLPRVDLPNGLPGLGFVPEAPSGSWAAIAAAVLSIALIASLESLLSALAIDKLRDGPRTDLNRELIGQGLANVAAGSFGGFPVTGVVVRTMTNFEAGARTRMSTILHSVWILGCCLFLTDALRLIPLAALAGLLVYVGAKLVNLTSLREVRRHGDLPVYLATLTGAVAVNLLTGVVAGIAVALVLMLRRMLFSGIHVEPDGARTRVVIEGALTFLSVPRLTTVLAGVPERAEVTLELFVDYLDHAAFDCLRGWQRAHERAGGVVIVDEIGHPWFGRGKAGVPTVRRGVASRVVPRWLAPWSEWQAEHLELPGQRGGSVPLCRGASEFQRRTAPLLRRTWDGLADGQRPHTLFVTCGDARIVPNLITTSGPGDLFTVRNIGNLVPHASTEADFSVGAAIEYAVGLLRVREVVVCGHSGCGAMKALLGDAPTGFVRLGGWLRHGEQTLRRRESEGPVLLDGARPDRETDQLALHNVVQQLENLRSYPVVDAALARGELRLTGMYFDVGKASVYLLDAAHRSFTSAASPVSS